VLETQVIRPPSPDSGTLRITAVEPDRLTMAGGTNDPVTGLYRGMWLVLEPDGPKFYPIFGRSVSHHEMDLMAQLAGLELESRWADWKGTPFGPKSELHISIYRKP